jgi:hypothetical protein
LVQNAKNLDDTSTGTLTGLVITGIVVSSVVGVVGVHFYLKKKRGV